MKMEDLLTRVNYIGQSEKIITMSRAEIYVWDLLQGSKACNFLGGINAWNFKFEFVYHKVIQNTFLQDEKSVIWKFPATVNDT